MIDVAYDEIALDDERRIRSIVKRLHLPQLGPFERRVVDFNPPPERVAHSGSPKPLAYWERYLPTGRTTFAWHEKSDIWLTPSEERGVLRRLVISGLSAEKDAKVLRSEAWRFSFEARQRLTPDEARRIATEVKASRAERNHQQTFQSALTKVRHYFKWEGDRVVDGDGWILPLSKLRLRDDEVELLRRVFASLPRPLFSPTGEEDPAAIRLRDAPCPLCGGVGGAEGEPKETPHKDRKDARKKIANSDFMAWVNARLTGEDKSGVWTLVRPLYDDYAEWVSAGRDYQTDTAKGESKAAVLSETAWGTLMGKMYKKRRDGKKGKWYNVRLKKRKAERCGAT